MTHYRLTHAEHVRLAGGYVDPDRYVFGHQDYRPEMICRTGDAHARGTRYVTRTDCPACRKALGIPTKGA